MVCTCVHMCACLLHTGVQERPSFLPGCLLEVMKSTRGPLRLAHGEDRHGADGSHGTEKPLDPSFLGPETFPSCPMRP